MASCWPPEILSVAASLESKHPGIEPVVMVRMVDAISQVNGKLFYPIPEVVQTMAAMEAREDAICER